MLRSYNLIVIILLFLALVGCQHPPTLNYSPNIVYNKTSQSRQLPYYNKVVVKGRININLHTGYRHPEVILQGDVSDVQAVATSVKNNTLYISVGQPHPYYGLTITIRAPNLNSFTYNGVGKIRGSRLNTRRLNLSIINPKDTILGGHINLSRLEVGGGGTVRLSGVSGYNTQIIIHGKSRVQIVGLLNVGPLNLYGDGFLSAYWVKNERLIVKEHGNVHLQLAGVAGILEVELWDYADFNGRYLRANRAFVKTHDHSIAKLNTIRRQHTLASDASDIYFYNLPELRAGFMAYDGAILDMRDWNLLCEQEYTIYNL